MSQRRVEAGSERINGVSDGGGPDIGLQAVAPHHTDASIEQPGDVVLDSDVFIDSDPDSGIDLDHDIDIAVGALLAARA